MIVVDDPIEFVRRRPDMFFRSGVVDPVQIVMQVVGDILTITSGRALAARVNDWWIVGCDQDWFRHSLSVGELFRRMVPLPEAGQNSIRSEVVIAAYSERILVRSSSGVEVIVNEVRPDDDIWTELSKPDFPWYAVAFCVDRRFLHGST